LLAKSTIALGGEVFNAPRFLAVENDEKIDMIHSAARRWEWRKTPRCERKLAETTEKPVTIMHVDWAQRGKPPWKNETKTNNRRAYVMDEESAHGWMPSPLGVGRRFSLLVERNEMKVTKQKRRRG